MWQRSAIESNLSLLLWESVSLLLATTVSVLSVYFFFKASGSQTYWERKYIKKRNPQTRLEAQIKMKREMERGGEKRGGDQSNFLWRGISLFGLSGNVPGLQLKVNFFY